MRWAAMIGLTLAGISGGLFLGLHQALHQQPSFYRDAVAVPGNDQRRAGRAFERSVLALRNDVEHSQRWEETFTDDQINGWLAVELPEKLPELLPPSVQQPRIALTPGRLRLAFRYDTQQVSTVVSLTLDVTLADDPHSLAIRIREARAGWVPLPLKDFLDQISQAARRGGVDLRWAQCEGDPVALVRMAPRERSEDAERLILEQLVIEEGSVTVAGSTQADSP